MPRLLRPGGQNVARYFHTFRSNQYAKVSSTNVESKKGKGKDGKERLVLLGSGWGAMSLLKSLDQVSLNELLRWNPMPNISSLQKMYDVSVVSPNTYFAMTPLLAQAATGTLEVRGWQRVL